MATASWALRPASEADAPLLQPIMAKAGLSTLLPRPSIGNGHTGHYVGTAACASWPRIAVGSGYQAVVSGAVVVGVVVLGEKDADVGKLYGIALDPDAVAATDMEAGFAAAIGLAVAALKDRGCRRIAVEAWFDGPIDTRGGSPLAALAGGRRDQGAALTAALTSCGFVEKAGAEDREVMFGRPLSNLPPMPALCEGYTARHLGTGAASEADATAWQAWQRDCFPEPDCRDPAFTVPALYTTRSDYHPEELVLVSAADAPTKVAAAGTGVVHSFEAPAAGNGTARLKLKICYLDWIGVNTTSRGKGLGRYVSLACLHHLYERGEAYCTLWTVPGRAAAVRLYTKLGFVEIAAMRAYEYQCPHRS